MLIGGNKARDGSHNITAIYMYVAECEKVGHENVFLLSPGLLEDRRRFQKYLSGSLRFNRESK